MPSVIDQIREKEGAPHKVYKNIICSNIVDGSHQARSKPQKYKASRKYSVEKERKTI
jgi:hypothetical protein